MTTYSYTKGFNNTPYMKGSSAVNTDNLPAHPNQVEKYVELCLEKKITPKDTSKFTRKTISEAIQALMRFRPASDPQKELIVKMAQPLVEAGLLEKMPSDQFMERLSKENASKLIEDMRDMEKKNTNILPLNEYQIERLLEMYLCPDVPFEAINVLKRVEGEWVVTQEGKEYIPPREITETISIPRFKKVTTGEFIVKPNGERVELWEKLELTPTEFVEELKNNVNQALANYIIDEYQDKYYQWRRTRASESQIERYRQLETNMYTIDKPKQRKEGHVDLFGEEYDGLAEGRSADRAIRTENFEPTSEEVLRQLSSKEMTQLINQMQYESRQKEVIGTGQEVIEVHDREEYRALIRKHDKEKTIIRAYWKGDTGYIEAYVDTTAEGLRESQSIAQWNTREYTKLNDLIYKLEAVAGYEYESLHDSVRDLMLYKNDTGVHTELDVKNAHHIREFMMSLVTDGSIDFNGLARLCEDCETAQQILLGTY